MPNKQTNLALITVKKASIIMQTTTHSVLTAAASGSIKAVALPGRPLMIVAGTVDAYMARLGEMAEAK
jgi:hypothetical protein